MLSQRITLAFSLFVLTAAPAVAVECRSVGGHLNGEPVTAVRQATLIGKKLRLGGVFNSVRSPSRSLSCLPLHAGILCEREFGPVVVSVMTNKKRMIETVTSLADGKEQASVAYVCNGYLKF
jgi:hypothetical protein